MTSTEEMSLPDGPVGEFMGEFIDEGLMGE